jgi:hypothetical protein
VAASTSWDTSVCGTHVAVVTVHGVKADALTDAANVSRGAIVAVIAAGSVGRKGAAGFEIACVVCADISVVTNHRDGSSTTPTRTLVVQGTRVAIVAGQVIEYVLAAAGRITRVRSARVAVVAGIDGGDYAGAIQAGFSDRAWASIITACGVVGVDTLTRISA